MIRKTASLRGTLTGVATLLAMLLSTAATAAVPQTIAIDGVNDFDVANLLEDDGGDTEETNFCADDPEVDTPMDIKAVYVTNDANNLYIGFEYDRECFSSPQVNLGIAFTYGAAGDGGTTDPFARKIAWNTITRKPDNVVYAVIDGFNFEVFYQWNGTGWTDVQSGSNGLGMANDLGFEELALPLSLFTNGGISGLSADDVVGIEIWMTQDGTTKPPLDAMASDDVQTSTAGGTTFDVAGAEIEMTAFVDYTILDATDSEAPVVTGVSLVDGDASQVRVTFNEPVDATTGGNAANYAIASAGGSATVSAASVTSNVVVLTTAASLPGEDGLYTLTLSGVEDAAGNAANDAYDFALKELVFEGLFGPFLQSNGTGPTDFFTVEGSIEPLDFNLLAGDDQMTLVNALDEIYQLAVPFAFFVGPNGGAPVQTSRTLEWKFAFNALQFETRNNRIAIIATGDDGSTTLSRFWDDLDPSQFTGNDIDVIFTLDTAGLGIQGGDTIELAGNVAPLSFDSPYTALVDDGTGQDASAGDGIFTVAVTFPAGSLKNVNFKYVFNAQFECFGQGDRTLFLNDELFDTIGGTNGPLVLPVATFDRCSALAGPTDVVFSVDINGSGYDVPGPLGFDVLLAGDVDPLTFDLQGGSPALMRDDGIAPDAVADDRIYAVSVTFPDSSNRFLNYKYVVNNEFEAQGLPNRSVTLDDADGAPQVLPTDRLNFTVPTDVGDGTPARRDRLDVKAVPNPFNPQTSIVFALPARADVAVEIFDARGRRLRTLHQGSLDAGEHTRVWDGRTDEGSAVASGVYFARVAGGGFASATRLVLVK